MRGRHARGQADRRGDRRAHARRDRDRRGAARAGRPALGRGGHGRDPRARGHPRDAARRAGLQRLPGGARAAGAHLRAPRNRAARGGRRLAAHRAPGGPRARGGRGRAHPARAGHLRRRCPAVRPARCDGRGRTDAAGRNPPCAAYRTASRAGEAHPAGPPHQRPRARNAGTGAPQGGCCAGSRWRGARKAPPGRPAWPRRRRAPGPDCEGRPEGRNRRGSVRRRRGRARSGQPVLGLVRRRHMRQARAVARLGPRQSQQLARHEEAPDRGLRRPPDRLLHPNPATRVPLAHPGSAEDASQERGRARAAPDH